MSMGEGMKEEQQINKATTMMSIYIKVIFIKWRKIIFKLQLTKVGEHFYMEL